MLENVKNLVSHDKGNTFKVIKNTLISIGYSIYYQVLDSKHFVPQHRERIIIVGFRNDVFKGKENFRFPKLPEPSAKIKDILEEEIETKYTLTDKLWNYLQNYAAKHKAQGNGFGFGMTDLNGISRTISARYYKDGSEIFYLGVPLRVGLFAAIFLPCGTKRISASIPNATAQAA